MISECMTSIWECKGDEWNFRISKLPFQAQCQICWFVNVWDTFSKMGFFKIIQSWIFDKLHLKSIWKPQKKLLTDGKIVKFRHCSKQKNQVISSKQIVTSFCCKVLSYLKNVEIGVIVDRCKYILACLSSSKSLIIIFSMK